MSFLSSECSPLFRRLKRETLHEEEEIKAIAA
jgi:hypothetical protein